MLLLILAALSMGLSNFAGAIAIGVSGVSAKTRLKVGVVFGLFEGGMPLIGLLVGHTTAHGRAKTEDRFEPVLAPSTACSRLPQGGSRRAASARRSRPHHQRRIVGT